MGPAVAARARGRGPAVSLNWVDFAVLVGVLLVGFAGWRAGVISTAAAFAGFFGGALLGAWLAPRLLADSQWPTMAKAAVTLAGMLLLGSLGQALLGAGGRAVRDTVTVRPFRLLDRVTGMVVSAVAFLLSMWLLLTLAAQLPVSAASEEVRSSYAFPLLDRVLSGPGGALIDDARSLLATIDLPSLPFNPATLPQVDDPVDVELTAAVSEVAGDSVLRVSATSRRCATSTLGSAVVVGPRRLVTNAHVVTGASRVTVQTTSGRSFSAEVVYLDPDTDLAVLYAAELDAPAAHWAPAPDRGTSAAVVGYPGGGRLTLRPARVRGLSSLPEESSAGLREVVVIRGVIQPGNSGGALLDLDGDVIGLIFANSSVDEQTGFALSPVEVVPVIEETATDTEPVSPGACPAAH